MLLRLIVRLSDWFDSLPEDSQNIFIGFIFLVICVFVPIFIKSYDLYKRKKRKSEIKYKYDPETKSFIPVSNQTQDCDSQTSDQINSSDKVFSSDWYEEIKKEISIHTPYDGEAKVIKYTKHFDLPEEYTGKYQKRLLLTKNEYHEYQKLKEYANKRSLIICPKIRLLDLIEPIRGHKNYRTLLRKVMSKHIDFVICDENLRVKAVLELDDNSHNTEERIERDSFVNSILEDVGYVVIRTRGITEDTLSVLDSN